jgi:hypothetical protein
LCQTKTDFKNYLLNSSLQYIKTLWIVYRLSKSHVLQIKLKNSDSSGNLQWQVYLMDEPFFLFVCNEKKSFMKVFEEHLRKELEKRPFIRTKQPSGGHKKTGTN